MKMVLILALSLFSSLVLSSDREVFFTSQVELKEKKLSKSERFENYMNWGQTFEKFFKNDSMSLKYYQKALKSKTRFNKIPTYFKVVYVASKSGNYELAESFFSKMKRYARKNPSKHQQNFINQAQKSFYSLKQNSKKIIRNTNKLKGSLLANAKLHNYRARFLRKEYRKALREINIDSAEINKNYEMQVEYDVLKMLTTKKYKNLSCEGTFKNNKELMLVNHTHMTCSILMDFVSNKKLTVTKLKLLKENINKNFPNKEYLITALNDLRK